jgi:hypothetical protein
MPRADAGPTGVAPEKNAPAGSAPAEQFTARNPQGQQVVIVKAPAKLAEDAAGGIHWRRGGGEFTLLDGSAVERVDESTFRIASTGETVRREEGQHGVTHHPEHQTPAEPSPPTPSRARPT